MERRDPDFDRKMTQVLHVYKEVELIRQMGKDAPPVTVLSYDEKPGIQAVSKKFPTFLRFQANIHVLQGIMIYKRHGTVIWN
ncbi:MAG: hypothetical protein SWO11_08135 [Thermodesulfobacteriota bacterium]|nr:hypothetical protein [Thermodesulfobacteriota bacterium]